MMWVLMLAGSLLLFPVSADAAGRIFHEDFESYSTGTLPGTQWTVSGTPQVVTSAVDGVTGAHGGSKFLKTAHPGASVSDQAQTPVASYTDEIFYRFWLRADTNHDGEAYPGVGGKYLRFFILSGSYIIDKFVVYHRSGGGLINSGQFGHINDDQDTYFGGAGGDSSDTYTRWQKVEMYFNTSTGVCKIWNDGILVTNVSGRTLNGVKATQIELVSNADSMDGTNDMYFDDIEIFADSGTGGSGSMSDGTITQGSTSTGTISGGTRFTGSVRIQ